MSLPQSILNLSIPNFNNSNKLKQNKPLINDSKDLICNNNDDQKTLLSKNKNLLQLIIQSSSKIAELVYIEVNQNENKRVLVEEHNIEKQEWLIKLEKITNNYKTYAESYHNFTVIKDNFDSLQGEFQQNLQILKHYESLIQQLLKDFIANFKKINFYLNSEKLTTNVDLSNNYFIRHHEETREKIISYYDKIDKYNFKEIYNQLRSSTKNLD